MSFPISGKERIQRYAVYQELEQRYQGLLTQKQDLEAELARKDETIRTLARELAALVGTEAHPSHADAVASAFQPVLRKSTSGFMARPEVAKGLSEALKQAANMAQMFDQLSKARQASSSAQKEKDK